MRRGWLAVLLALGASLLLGAAASAQSPEPTAAPASAPVATAVPQVTAPPPRPAPHFTPAPVTTPDPEKFIAPATPPPMALPDWMEAHRPTPEPSAGAAADTTTAAGPVVSSVVNPSLVTPGRPVPVQGVPGAPGYTASAGDPSVAGPADPGPSGRPVETNSGDAASSDSAILPASSVGQRTCEAKVMQHEMSGDKGAIVQTAVQNEDCSWGGSQVLVGYDSRGPPGVDVLVQSTGVDVDVEAVVTKEKVRLAVGHRDSDGDLIPVGPRALGSGATATQTGSNRVEIAQDALATSGDATSGSQRVRVHVDGDARWVRVMAQNASPGASASTGNAVTGNAVAGTSGVASGSNGLSQTGQVGDNATHVDQTAQARSGDALAGSQEIDVEVTGSVGELSVMGGNSSPNSVAFTGDAVATNAAAASAGAQTASGTGTAQSGQVGDNYVDLDQTAVAESGDAVSASQVIGIRVGGDAGRIGVLATNDASGALAMSGDAVALNAGLTSAGPTATANGGSAMSSQVGDNRVDVSQLAVARSGRALAGAQVISITVGGRVGKTAVMPANIAVGVAASSGNAVASNDLAGSVGPVAQSSGTAATQHLGDNEVNALQSAQPTSGDAVAGGQVIGQVQGVGQTAATAARPVLDPVVATAETVVSKTDTVMPQADTVAKAEPVAKTVDKTVAPVVPAVAGVTV